MDRRYTSCVLITSNSKKTNNELVNSFASISPEILYKNGSEMIQNPMIIGVTLDMLVKINSCTRYPYTILASDNNYSNHFLTSMEYMNSAHNRF